MLFFPWFKSASGTVKRMGQMRPTTRTPPGNAKGAAPARQSQGHSAVTDAVIQVQKPKAASSPVAQENKILYGGVHFHPVEITNQEGLIDTLSFNRVINTDLKISPYLQGRLSVVKLSDSGKEVAILVDRHSSTPDEVSELAALIKNSGYVIVQAFFAVGMIVLSLSQGHLQASAMRSARDIARDPAKNALFKQFISIISYAYKNKADDVDWAVDQSSRESQIAFKIGGRYIRPAAFRISTETMLQILGIAWQRTGGGASSQFDVLIEQQAQLTLDIPRSADVPNGAHLRLRWSGMANDKGTTVTMRLQRLGESALVKSLDEAGYLSTHMNIFRRVINSEGGLVCFSGVVGSGKSTSLARLLAMLPHYLKIQSIEDPVELEIPMAYQKTVARDLQDSGQDKAFLSAARAIYRSALDVLYLGEVRDTETGGIARQVVESGHTVYTTTHAASSLGVIDRLSSPQIGIPRDVLGAPDIVKLLVYQALLPVSCPHCSKSPSDYVSAFSLRGNQLDEHQAYWDRVERLFGVGRERYRMVDPNGCEHCRKEGLEELNGFNGRTVVCEMIEPDETMQGMFLDVSKKIEVKKYWCSLSDGRFDTDNMIGKTAMENAIYKATIGAIDPRQIEQRFKSFETIEFIGSMASNAHRSLKAVA